MQAALLAIGSELLGPDRLDTNALLITRFLERYGVQVVRKLIIGDDEALLSAEVARLVEAVDLVIIGGGLGPTADDVTREAVAAALGRSLDRSSELEAQIAARFASFGMRMPDSNRKQADVIAGGVVLDNRWGSAPGQRVDVAAGDGRRGCSLFLFPGVPRELEGMITAHLEPWLAERSGGRGVETWTLKVACIPESTVDTAIQPAYAEFGREAITILAAPGEVRLRFGVSGAPAERQPRLEAIRHRLRELVGKALFVEDDTTTLEAVVGAALRQAGATVATAESCTGGLVAERLTRVAGSSDYMVGALVAYANQVKVAQLGIPEELLQSHGAVSAEVARSMADGARRLFGSTFGIGITGIAGPTGGSDEKPVGTVHLALAGPATASEAATAEDGEPPAEPFAALPGAGGYGSASSRQVLDGNVMVEQRVVRFPGDRERVRLLASQFALEMLRRRLLKLSVSGIDAR